MLFSQDVCKLHTVEFQVNFWDLRVNSDQN